MTNLWARIASLLCFFTSCAFAQTPSYPSPHFQDIIIDGTIVGTWTGTPIGLASQVSGNLPVANLGSGIGANNTTFWRGDGVWAVPAGIGGGGVSLGSLATLNAAPAGTLTGSALAPGITDSSLASVSPVLNANTPLTISGIPLDNSVTVTSTFGAPPLPGLKMSNGKPFYIATTPASAAEDTPAGTLYVSKDANYTGLTSGAKPTIYGFANIHAGAQGPQIGVLGTIFNANTLTTQPAGTSGAIGTYGVGICGAAGCTATWAGVIAAYDTSNQVNPTKAFYGLEVDNYAHGTDANLVRIGIQIVADTPDGAGTLNTVGRGLMFTGNGAASKGQYVILVDGTDTKATHGVLLSNMTFSSGATSIAYSSPGFQVNGIGDLTARTLTTSQYTVATLPACNAGSTGQLAVVTDLIAAPTYNTAVGAGGGANITLALCRNSAWTSH